MIHCARLSVFVLGILARAGVAFRIAMLATGIAIGSAQGATPHSSGEPGPARGPLARLIENPNPSGGLPPYALTDQMGAIQRYVEPVPGIDLSAHVGQVVVVRHDTGKILLASQLELPAQPLLPLMGGAATGGGIHLLPHTPQHFVQQAQYADDDDTTVELLEDDESLPDGKSLLQRGPTPEERVHSEGGSPAFPSGPTMHGGPTMGVPYGGPMVYGPMDSQWMSGDSRMAPCPECGGYHQAPCSSPSGPSRTRVYGDIEFNFLRLHLTEGTIGKLSERYELSPRFILGFTGLGPVNGRVRYWIYGQESETLGDDEEELQLDFNVLDLEGTHHFGGKRSEVVLAAGLRLAQIDLVAEDDGGDDAEAGSEMIGITMAADGRTQLAAIQPGRFAWVYGGRLSILGGDWGGDDEGFVDERVRDDNVVVHELYAGVEFTRCLPNFDLRARLAFELQNWHSDVLAASDSTDLESIGLVGPGLRIGAEY